MIKTTDLRSTENGMKGCGINACRTMYLLGGIVGFNPEYVIKLEEKYKRLRLRLKALIMEKKRLIDKDGQIAMSFIQTTDCSECDGLGYFWVNPSSKYSEKKTCPKCNGKKVDYIEDQV